MHIKLHPPDPTFVPNSPLHQGQGQGQGILADALSIRIQVFVDEQGCSAENEVDEDDARSWHWVIYEDEDEDETVVESESISRDGSTSMSMSNVEDGSKPQAQAQAQDQDKGKGKGKAIGTVRLVPPSLSQGINPASSVSNTGTNTGTTNTHPHTHADCSSPAYVKITRVAVLPTHRGHGIGRHLVETAVEWAGKHAATINGAEAEAEVDQDQDEDQEARAKKWTGLILVHAQVDVEGMYARLGFERDERMGRWMEEGIEHIGMWRQLTL